MHTQNSKTTHLKGLLSLLLLAGLNLSAQEKTAPPPSLVVTAAVERGMVHPLQTYVGTLYYDKKSDLASESEGAVSKLHFSEGEHVKEGDLLVTLDSAILQADIAAKAAQLDAQSAQLKRQERDLERSLALLERKSISQSSYDTAFFTTEALKAEVRSLENQLKALKIEAEKRHIRAPFDGIATTRNVEVGEWVSKGATVATIVAPSSIEAHLNIPADLLPTLRKQHQFSALIGEEEMQLTLKSVIPVADAASRTFPVELTLPAQKNFIEGMRIDVRVPTLKEQDALLVPRDAVIKRFGQTVVFAAVEGKAVMLPVQVVGYKQAMAAINAQGLKEQMRVVIKGNERIFPNMPVMEKR